MKDPLVHYYLHHASLGSHNGLGPVYSVPPYVQRGHGMESFLCGLLLLVRPVPWSGVKAVGRETLRTGGKILSDLADNISSDIKPRNITAKHVSDSAQILSRSYVARDVNASPH